MKANSFMFITYFPFENKTMRRKVSKVGVLFIFLDDTGRKDVDNKSAPFCPIPDM